MSTAQNMDMDMIHGLAGFGICIYHQAKAPFSDTLFSCYLFCNLKHTADERIVFVIYFESC